MRRKKTALSPVEGCSISPLGSDHRVCVRSKLGCAMNQGDTPLAMPSVGHTPLNGALCQDTQEICLPGRKAKSSKACADSHRTTAMSENSINTNSTSARIAANAPEEQFNGNPAKNSRAMIPLAEIAEKLNMPKRGLQNACKDGKLSHERKGRQYYLSMADVKEWLSSRRRTRTRTISDQNSGPVPMSAQVAVPNASNAEESPHDLVRVEGNSTPPSAHSSIQPEHVKSKPEQDPAGWVRLKRAKNSMRKFGPAELRSIQKWIDRRLGIREKVEPLKSI